MATRDPDLHSFIQVEFETSNTTPLPLAGARHGCYDTQPTFLSHQAAQP